MTLLLALLRRQISSESDDNDSTTVSWNAFCEMIESTVNEKTTIAYGPLFPQSPTNPDVVQASLDYFMSLTQRLNQRSTIVTCDQAIYDIVKGITKKHPIKYKSLVVRLGGFHIIENFLGAVGHFMKGSGIEEILADSEVCLKGTINKVIAGKDYYKMIRCHSLMCEAMINLMWNAFEDWLEKESDGQNKIIELQLNINNIQEAVLNDDSLAIKSNADLVFQSLSCLTPIWNEFYDNLGVTGKFWVMYIEMILIAKRYVYAERAGLWQNHLKETSNMLPYLVSAGHTRYMSCLPLYLKDMSELPEKHPDVFQKFEEGKFTVRQVAGPFNGVWTDLALEQTYNREGKTSLLKGISQSDEARNKYIKTVPVMTKVSESVRAMVHMDTPISKHHGESVRQSKEDLHVVSKMQDSITRSMIDPFSSDTNKTDLVNIVTGEKAPSTDLIKVKEKGLEAIVAAERNEADKIEVPKIKTFAQKKSKTSANKGLIQLYQDESSVTRALCFIQGADEDTRNEAFSHEWCKYPPSMFKPDAELKSGFAMNKSNKSDFLTALLLKVAGKASQPQELPPSTLATTYLIDTMAFIQRYRKMKARTFKELVEQYIQRMLRSMPENCTNLNIVGDRYDFDSTESLKGDERERRELKHEQGREYIMKDSLDIPDWNELMSNANNKGTLLSYFSNCLCQNAETFIPENTIVILGGLFETRSKCVAVRNAEVVDIQALACEQHEEADTRIMAHLAYCADTLGYKRAVIACTDTDIIMLAMYHFCFLPLQQLWIQKNDSFLSIHELVQMLAEKCEKPAKQVVASLLCAYVLSGCDTTSYFFRKGKHKAANTVLNLIGSFPNMADFGLDRVTEVKEEIRSEARHFVASLYGKGSFDNLDLLRQHIFPSGTDLRLMPPTDDAFHQHVLRCMYQLLLYHRARSSQLQLPPPTEFGRKIVDGRLCPVMMTKAPKPPNVKNAACKCKATRCLRNCSCAREKLRCFVGCLCLGNSENCGRLSLVTDDDDDNDEYYD